MKIFINIIFCAALFIILPLQAGAQVSQEAARLLRNANVQVINRLAVSRDFTLQLLTGGNTALSSYRGSVVILNFWATWCPPCRAEMPSMETFYQRYKEQELEILAVDLGEDVNTVRMFIQRNNFNFPVLLNIDRKIGSVYGIEAIPTTFIIDREGKIIGRIMGSINWDTPAVFSAFDALLNSR